MKYFGCVFLFLGLAFFSREYLLRRKKQCELYSALLSFFSHLENALARSVCPPSVIAKEFKCELLEQCGFLEALREGKSFFLAFEKVISAYKLPPAKEERLSKLFSLLRATEYSDMRKRVSSVKEEIKLVSLQENEELEKISKILPCLTAAFSAGFAILVI